MHDEHLLQRVAQGDQWAVREVIDLYGGLVAALANRYCLNLEDADDAIQEIFVELWKNASRFQPEKGAEVTFVAMIARRRLVDLNRRRRRDRPVVDIEVDSIPTKTWSHLGVHVEVLEQLQSAVDILNSLPEKQRRVIVMAIYGGLSHAALAREFELPLGTVKTWIRQGLRKMRLRLDRMNAPNLPLPHAYRKSVLWESVQ